MGSRRAVGHLHKAVEARGGADHLRVGANGPGDRHRAEGADADRNEDHRQEHGREVESCRSPPQQRTARRPARRWRSSHSSRFRRTRDAYRLAAKLPIGTPLITARQ